MNSTNFKLNKLHYFLLYLFLSLWLFARNGSGDDEIGPFKYTHYLFNYEYEFLKRGFVGEILSLFFNPLQYEVVNFISLIFLIILSIVFFNTLILFHGIDSTSSAAPRLCPTDSRFAP